MPAISGDQASEHREIAHVVKSLRMQPFQPLTLDLNDQVVWTSVLESFLRNHEKHDAFIMLNLKALDQAEYAISLAHNFSQCAGSSNVHFLLCSFALMIWKFQIFANLELICNLVVSYAHAQRIYFCKSWATCRFCAPKKTTDLRRFGNRFVKLLL